MTTRVSLSFSAAGLRDLDTFSKSDPYLVLYEVRQGRRVMIGRTETLKDSLAPTWLKSFETDFRFEARQDFVVELYDDDSKGPSGDDKLGVVEFPLAHVVSGRGGKCDKPVTAGSGTLTIASQSVSNAGNDTIVLRFGGTKLANMDFIGLSDPYFKLYRLHANGTKQLLVKSETIDNTLDPHWVPCRPLKVAELATADLDQPSLLFECYDEDVTSDDAMGEFKMSVNDLIRAEGQPAPFTLKDPVKAKTYGSIYVSQAKVTHYPKFPEFLAAGMQMNMAVAIDFTGSNGDPRNPQSLHFMNPTAPNQYVQAIMAVCGIVLEYDTDKLVPALGFGAQLPNGQVSHCFHLNAQPDPNVFGVQGILDAYGATLTAVRLAGPTNFAPTIRQASEASRLAAAGLVYQILLIITDGAITDTDATINAIVAASSLPLSIIIIGVGNADFSTMVLLDSDVAPLTDTSGKKATRDIVQFVAFRDFAAGPPDLLAAEVLREVPRQVESWALSAHVTPQTIASHAAASAGRPGGAASAPAPPPVQTASVAAAAPPAKVV